MTEQEAFVAFNMPPQNRSCHPQIPSSDIIIDQPKKDNETVTMYRQR